MSRSPSTSTLGSSGRAATATTRRWCRPSGAGSRHSRGVGGRSTSPPRRRPWRWRRSPPGPRLFELQRYYSWIVDRFHLSARAYQLAARGRDVDFAWLEERLLPLGFHVALLVRRPDTFAVARTARLAVSGNPDQYDDLDRLVAEQARLRRLAGESRLPVREFDVSDDDVAGACDRIADWQESDGGLWAPWD